MYSLDKKDYNENRPSNKEVDENSFDSMSVKEVDNDDSDSDLTIKSNTDIDDDDDNITSTEKCIVCKEYSKFKKGIYKFV